MNEELEYICSATLIILGNNLIPKKISELLEIVPNQTWEKGQQKSHITRDGKTNFHNSFYEWGGWKSFIPDEKANLELDEQLEYWCDLLKGRENIMIKLEKQKYQLRINCYISTSATASILISPDLQQRLASLRLELAFCIFADED